MSGLTPQEQFESTDLLKKREYELGYKQGWKDGVADLLKKQMEQAEAEQMTNETLEAESEALKRNN